MTKHVLLDTGPLVAFLNRRDRYHAWAKAQLATVEPPLATCEAVLSEACFLLRDLPGGSQAIVDLVRRELVVISFSLRDEVTPVGNLMTRYANVPMSLADACLVRMVELNAGGAVMTLDSDFDIYRTHRRRVIPRLMPPEVVPT